MRSMPTETLTFQTDDTPLDLLLWRRYRREVPGLVESALDTNYGLAAFGVEPPRGTAVTVEIPKPTATVSRPLVRLFD